MASTHAKDHLRILAALLAAAALSTNLSTDAQAKPRAVIELYTSQGCSSCPQADELFAKMAGDPDLITLSLPVDYWDRLGWKDTLAKHAFTERQEAYAGRRGDGQVYTPQAVVNGIEHAVGSQRSAIDAAVAETAASLRVPLSVKRDGNNIVVAVGGAEASAAAKATVVLMPFLGERDVAIGRGENARRTVTYTNIVRDIVPIANWNGKPIARTIPLEDFKNYDGLVVLLQAGSPGKPGAILGADRMALR